MPDIDVLTDSLQLPFAMEGSVQLLVTNGSSKLPMGDHVCISTNRTGKVGIDLACKAVMSEFRITLVPGAEIFGREHTPCGQDSYKSIEEWLLWIHTGI